MSDLTTPHLHLHETYWTRPEPLTEGDVDALHQLAVSVNWPHRPQDLAQLLLLGQGFIARDEATRPVGAGMSILQNDDAAMIGMMMTLPKLHAGGLGAHILTELQHLAGARALRLNATRQAWRLYRAAGFEDVGRVTQYQGVAAPHQQGQDAQVRAFDAPDVPAIAALDTAVFGTPRPATLKAIADISECLVLIEGDRLTGFAFCRPFGRGHVVGPLVAPSDEAACALIQPFLLRHAGRFLRVDADARHDGLCQFLNRAGIVSYDSVTPMTKGAPYGPESRSEVYALASQALG